MVRKILALILCCLAVLPAVAAAARQVVVLATPVKPDYSQEERINAILRDRFTVDIHHVTWSGRPDDQAQLIKQVRALRPTLVYAWGTPTALALAGPYDDPDPGRYLGEIPLVFMTVAWPEQVRLVRSLQQPGRPVTGVTHIASIAEQMRYLQQWQRWPHKRLGMLYNPFEQNSRITVAELIRWCVANGVELHTEAVRPGGDEAASVVAAVRRLADARVDWLYAAPDAFTGLTHARTMTAAAKEAGIPVFSSVETPIKSGSALWGLYGSREGSAVLAAEIMTSILNGSAADVMPVQRLKQKLAINNETMHQMQLYPPIELLRMIRREP